MKIVVISDSHGRMLDVYDAVERECPDAVIHLGDCYEDACELRHSYPICRSMPCWAIMTGAQMYRCSRLLPWKVCEFI